MACIISKKYNIVNCIAGNVIKSQQIDKDNFHKLNSTVGKINRPHSEFYTVSLGNTGLSKLNINQ